MALLPYQLGSVSPAVLLHLLSGVLLGVVATDKAPSRGTEHSVPASDKVPGGDANHRALDATFAFATGAASPSASTTAVTVTSLFILSSWIIR